MYRIGLPSNTTTPLAWGYCVFVAVLATNIIATNTAIAAQIMTRWSLYARGARSELSVYLEILDPAILKSVQDKLKKTGP